MEFGQQEYGPFLQKLKAERYAFAPRVLNFHDQGHRDPLQHHVHGLKIGLQVFNGFELALGNDVASQI